MAFPFAVFTNVAVFEPGMLLLTYFTGELLPGRVLSCLFLLCDLEDTLVGLILSTLLSYIVRFLRYDVSPYFIQYIRVDKHFRGIQMHHGWSPHDGMRAPSCGALMTS